MTNKKLKGFSGEIVVSSLLNKLDKSKYFIINGITLKVGENTAQIDHIVVSQYGIFVIETKNWKGSVYGNHWSKKFYQYLGGMKYEHQNPISQNYGHIKRLEEVLSEYPNLKYISIVAFGGYTKRKIKDDITIKISELLETIESYKEEVISEEDRESVYTRLKSLKVEGESYEKEHVETMKERYGK
jgi:hypothetical protein